jgi:hypothetical protein
MHRRGLGQHTIEIEQARTHSGRQTEHVSQATQVRPVSR